MIDRICCVMCCIMLCIISDVILHAQRYVRMSRTSADRGSTSRGSQRCDRLLKGCLSAHPSLAESGDISSAQSRREDSAAILTRPVPSSLRFHDRDLRVSIWGGRARVRTAGNLSRHLGGTRRGSFRQPGLPAQSPWRRSRCVSCSLVVTEPWTLTYHTVPGLFKQNICKYQV